MIVELLCVEVDIGTEWNLKYVVDVNVELSQKVDIGTEWNLKDADHGKKFILPS